MPVISLNQLRESRALKYHWLAALADGREPYTSSPFGDRDGSHYGRDRGYHARDEPDDRWQRDGDFVVPQGTPVYAPCDAYVGSALHPWESKSGGHVWLNIHTSPCPVELVKARTIHNTWDPVLGPWSTKHSTGWCAGAWHMRMVFVRKAQVIYAGQLVGLAGFDPRNNPGGKDLIHIHDQVNVGADKRNDGAVDPAPLYEHAEVLPYRPIEVGMVNTPTGITHPVINDWSATVFAAAQELEHVRSDVEGTRTALLELLKTR